MSLNVQGRSEFSPHGFVERFPNGAIMAILGIDISKATFHAHLIAERGEAKKAFPNSTTGFGQLDSWLRNRGVGKLHACMEATGSYWEALALHLHEHGHGVSVVNPGRTKAYAQSEQLRSKTDAVDAALIARFCQSQKLQAWEPPAPEIRMLQALSRHLEYLKSTRAEYLTRAQTPMQSGLVERSMKVLIMGIDREIAEVEQAIRDHFDQHPGLKRRRDLLTSIPGIGETTATTILSEFVGIEGFKNAKQVGAWAGLSPAIRQSGTSLRGKGRICKAGNARLRKGLYFPALTAKRCNPLLMPFAERLSAAGKHPMVILCALMRKLLVLAYGVLKSGRPFDAAIAGA